MKIEKNQIDDLNLKLTVEVAVADYAAAEKKRLSEYRRTADFKGFRRGMVPMGMIQRIYGEQALVAAVNEVLTSSLENYIKEENLRVIGEPMPAAEQAGIEWKSGNCFTFVFDMATVKDVELALSKEDKLPYYEIKITDVARKEMKDNMLSRFGGMEEGDAAKEDDLVIADLSNGVVNAESVYISVKRVEGTAHDNFLGARAGDEFQVNVNEAFVNDTDRASLLKVKKEQLEGLNPEFTVKVVNVKTYKAAVENQETYDRMFGPDKVHNAVEFDKAVEERLAYEYRQEADYRLNKDIREYLVKKAAIALPEDFLKRWLIKENEGKDKAEDIEKEFPGFLEDYRWMMVKDYIMKKNGIKISAEEVQQAAREYVVYQYAMYNMGGMSEDIMTDTVRNMMKNENYVRRFTESVEDRKVIAVAKEAVTLQKKKITVEKFRELK